MQSTDRINIYIGPELFNGKILAYQEVGLDLFSGKAETEGGTFLDAKVDGHEARVGFFVVTSISQAKL